MEAEIVPLVNLAECHRHWGQLSEAVDCLEDTVALARAQVKSAPTRDTRRQLAEIVLKLGIRYAELGDFDRAGMVLDEAGTHATDVDSWGRDVSIWTHWANLKLWQH